MRNVMPVVEQLDRAIAELRLEHPISDRLALILVDNALELIIHRRCQHEVRMDREWAKLGQSKLSDAQKRAGLGGYLDGKLRLLCDLGLVSEAERNFVNVSHHYRNELYHVGLAHEDVTRAIAGRSFQLACDLFPRLHDGFLANSSNDRMTAVGEKYRNLIQGPDGNFSLSPERLAPALREQLPPMPHFPSTLAHAARRALEEVEGSFQFLVEDNPGGMSASAVLRYIQFEEALARERERRGLSGTIDTEEKYRSYLDLKAGFEREWKPKHHRLPIRRWMARADRVQHEPDDLIALDRYHSLRSDMMFLESTIHDSAVALDMHIQHEIDVARGK